MFKNFNKIKQKRRNLFALVVGFFLIILCFILLFSVFDKNNSRRMTFKYLTSVTEGVTKTVDLWVEEKKDALSFVSELPEVRNALQNRTLLSDTRVWLSTNYPLELKTIFFISTEGEFLMGERRIEMELSSLEQLKLWIKSVNNTHQISPDNYVYREKEGQHLSFILLKGVYNEKDNLLGFIGFRINWDNFIEKFITPVKVGKTGYLAITDTKGRNIGHRDNSLTLKSMRGYEWMQKIIKEQNGEQAYKFKGINKLMVFRKSQQTDWIINTSVNEDELIEPTNHLRNVMLLASLVLLLATFFIIVWLDLIKLQRTRKRLIEEERNLRLLFRNGNNEDFSECSVFSSCLMNAFEKGNDSVFIHKIQADGTPGGFIKVNEAFLDFFNCSLESISEMQPADIFDKSTQDSYNALFARFLKQGSQAFTEELEMKHQSGFIELRLFRIKTKEELGILGFVRDITDRITTRHRLKEDRDYLDEEVKKRTNEILAINDKLIRNLNEKDEIARALADSEMRYRSLIERANDGIMLIANSQIIFANRKMCLLLKYDLAKLEKMSFGEIVVEEDRRKVMMEHKNRLTGSLKSSSIFETSLLTSEGEKIEVEINAVVIYEQQIPQDFLFVRDVRLRKSMEEEKRQQQEQLIQADKLAALGTLLTGVAHEINNPNNAIMLNSPIIKEAWESINPILEVFEKENGDFIISGMPYSYFKDYMKNLIDDVSKSSEKIKNIVEELKNFARPDTATFYESIKINGVVNSAINLMKSQIKATTNNFKVELEESIPDIEGSFVRLEQVIVNLLQNACHSLSSNEGGLSVKTFYQVKEDVVQVKIKDEGCGISKKNLKQIFDPFFTTKREKGGTGLGLSVSLKIIKEHQGTLTFSSKEGKGTTAIITLPTKKEKI